MNIVIFGASRGVGRAAVEIAAARGHAVTGVARTAALAGLAGTMVAGDVLDPALGAKVLGGADAVIVALGTAPGSDGQQGKVCSQGTRVILAAMQAAALRRIVVVSSYGVGPTRDRLAFPFNIVAATLLKNVMADKELQESEVRSSDTDWTIVQPLGLTDEPATGRPFVATDGSRQTTQNRARRCRGRLHRCDRERSLPARVDRDLRSQITSARWRPAKNVAAIRPGRNEPSSRISTGKHRRCNSNCGSGRARALSLLWYAAPPSPSESGVAARSGTKAARISPGNEGLRALIVTPGLRSTHRNVNLHLNHS
jgi:putative NADH-flavin reductase